MARTGEKISAQTKILDAAVKVIRTKGYCAASVDDLCAEAGVTKGAFFHYFKSKDELGVAVADYWSVMTGGFFANAPYHAPADPLDRVLAYIDFRQSMLKGEVWAFTCLAGTMVQETYEAHHAIRDACARAIAGHAETLEADIAAAMAAAGIRGDWTAQSLALHTQAVLQGAFILAKATNDVAVAVASVRHLRRYVELLFHVPHQAETAP